MKPKIIIITCLFALTLLLQGCSPQLLSDEEVIKIANKAAKAKGLNPEEYAMYFDRDNVQSSGIIQRLSQYRSDFSEFSGKIEDYQAVIYRKKPDKGKENLTPLSSTREMVK